MNKMPPLVAAPVPIPPSSTSMALASHLTDIYGHHPHQGHATPPMAALSNQHRQLLELQTRYLAASRLAALGGAAGGVQQLRDSHGAERARGEGKGAGCLWLRRVA